MPEDPKQHDSPRSKSATQRIKAGSSPTPAAEDAARRPAPKPPAPPRPAAPRATTGTGDPKTVTGGEKAAKAAPRPPAAQTAMGPARAAKAEGAEKKGGADRAEIDRGTVVVYMAVRQNDRVPVEVPGRDRRVQTAPGGFRIGLLLDSGQDEGVEAMNYLKSPQQSPTEAKSSIELTATSYGFLKALEFAHDQRPDARTIVIRSHYPNALEAQNNRAHPSARYNWIATQHLSRWGATVRVEQVEMQKNKATAVVAKTNLPNYLTAEARANLAGQKQQYGGGGGNAGGAAVHSAGGFSVGDDGLPVLFDPSLSAEELERRISAVQEQVEMAKAMLAVKQKRGVGV